MKAAKRIVIFMLVAVLLCGSMSFGVSAADPMDAILGVYEGYYYAHQGQTGVTLTDWRFRGVVTFLSDRWEGEYMHLFHATDFEGELTDCDEGSLEWVKKEAFHRLPQWEGDRIFLRLMEQRVPFFSLKLCYEGEHLQSATLDGKPL